MPNVSIDPIPSTLNQWNLKAKVLPINNEELDTYGFGELTIPNISIEPIPSTMNEWTLNAKILSIDEIEQKKLQDLVDQIDINGCKNYDKFSEEWIVDINDVDSLLGKGGSGTVYKCYKKSFISNICNEYVNGNKFCCKIINLTHLKNKTKIKIIHNTINEYNLVKNAHLLNYKDIYIDNKEYKKIVIVMEQLQNSLNNINKCLCFKNYDFKYEQYEKGIITFLDENSLRRFAFDLAVNIQKIHDLEYAHFDIKPENIMFNNNTKKWCIIDYGLYRKINTGEIIKRKGILGTRRFVAPEISINKKIGTSILTQSADIYAFGLILLKVINGGKLYEHYKIWGNGKKLCVKNGNSTQFMHSKQGHYELYQYLKYLLLFGIINQNLYDLLKNILQFDRKLRPNINEIICMKYFDKIRMKNMKNNHEN